MHGCLKWPGWRDALSSWQGAAPEYLSPFLGAKLSRGTANDLVGFATSSLFLTRHFEKSASPHSIRATLVRHLDTWMPSTRAQHSPEFCWV